MTQRYVIHLPIVATDLPAAQRLARVVGRWRLVLPQTEPGGTTVSAACASDTTRRSGS
ncbi:hypothetical protein AB0F68_07625 [Micromonospora sp. NPDC023966]|uniref:hypothetical protein n=1 Tax=Micromonospora sp. NPDC023966 TaxID=3154699 RepID=UPI0033CDAA87